MPVTDGWKFIKADVNGAEAVAFDDSKWSQVSMPHTWNDKDTLKGGNYYRGPGWYRIKLAIPETAKRQTRYSFTSRRQVWSPMCISTACILGSIAEDSPRFAMSLHPILNRTARIFLRCGLIIRTFEDVPPLSGDFNIYGGIYRPVWLIIKNPVCITPLDYASDGVYIKQTKVSKRRSDIDVLAKISNGLDKPVSAALLAYYRDDNGVFQTDKKIKI